MVGKLSKNKTPRNIVHGFGTLMSYELVTPYVTFQHGTYTIEVISQHVRFNFE